MFFSVLSKYELGLFSLSSQRILFHPFSCSVYFLFLLEKQRQDFMQCSEVMSDWGAPHCLAREEALMHPLAVSVEGGIWSLKRAFDTICRIKLHNKLKINFIPVSDINNFDVSDACVRADHVISNWSKASYCGSILSSAGKNWSFGPFLQMGFNSWLLLSLCVLPLQQENLTAQGKVSFNT